MQSIFETLDLASWWSYRWTIYIFTLLKCHHLRRDIWNNICYPLHFDHVGCCSDICSYIYAQLFEMVFVLYFIYICSTIWNGICTIFHIYLLNYIIEMFHSHFAAQEETEADVCRAVMQQVNILSTVFLGTEQLYFLDLNECISLVWTNVFV